ncbi:hypothetical protein GLYMA_02G125500v4 [Glycine max]|uniref:Uncharacterized protein n=2 Tax=Glycine subgen. Soja TaxID=1462606 RepID=A0A0R0KW58_SOYBN|nr:hypothetical protein JHK87_003797 [Glycine soja]KAG5062920.1 hypothetical protein JHK85_004103 [Glycine max]KAG5079862.1 hypothetical protein JHK86_003927 [Glycine max]KAH1060026.1 hypothetical protein GYH30_003822 [Glycine max]KRH71047.1 hypothetical protein GLYMA_02G125500v4 [Glycine max]
MVHFLQLVMKVVRIKVIVTLGLMRNYYISQLLIFSPMNRFIFVLPSLMSKSFHKK